MTKMIYEQANLELLWEAILRLEKGFQSLPEVETSSNEDDLEEVLLGVVERMQDNFPYHHPLYVGQMQKPPAKIASLTYALSFCLNPNNSGRHGARASLDMEKEAVSELAKMFGWETHLGHLCGGGTIANLEGLWIAGLSVPNKKIVASSQAHFSHERHCHMLCLPFESIPCNSQGQMNISALEKLLDEDDIGTVVATIGTTLTGALDSLPKILKLQSQYGFRIHVDAAYGGYFTLLDNWDAETRSIFDCLQEVDSIVIDPHKHGLQPYGCGCILFKDPSVGQFYKHYSPLNLQQLSLEGSRSGSSAVALWATQRLLPLIPGGKFATDLSKSRKAALTLFEKLQKDNRFFIPFCPQLDIVVWTPIAQSASEASRLAKEIFKESAIKNLHLVLADLPKELFLETGQAIQWDQEYITCLRSCLIKPEHLGWIEHIWEILDSVTDKVLRESGYMTCS